MAFFKALLRSPWDDPSDKPFESFFRNRPSFLKPSFHYEPGKPFFLLVLAGIVLLWLASGFYIVQEDEQALVLRFGRYARVAGSGANYRLPYPLEQHIKAQVTRIQREEIGFRSASNAARYDPRVIDREIPQESLMLTGDENIIDVNFIVQWKIRNIQEYIFNLSNTATSVKAVSESAMREVIGNSKLQQALTGGRSAIEVQTATLIQRVLDFYEAGVDVISVQMLKVDPPTTEVINAFRDVQTAEQDKEKAINRAKAYRNKILPEARGNAAKMLEESRAYQREVVEKARGEAGRFDAVYTEYKKAQSVTRRRLYLETMETVLGDMNKILMDNEQSGVLPYLPLDRLLQQGGK